jgi:hypothetical protein
MIRYLKNRLSQESRQRLAEELLRRLDEDAERERLNSLHPSLSMFSCHLSPPKHAQFLLRLFLTRSDGVVISDDLEEEFKTEILPTLGARRARRWYWAQTARTISYRNPLCRWLLTGGSVHKCSVHKSGDRTIRITFGTGSSPNRRDRLQAGIEKYNTLRAELIEGAANNPRRLRLIPPPLPDWPSGPSVS